MKGLDSKHPYGIVVARIHDLLNCDWQVRICHIFRKANRSVDYLAIVGHSLNIGTIFYLFVPPCLGASLGDDLAGVAIPRLVS